MDLPLCLTIGRRPKRGKNTFCICNIGLSLASVTWWELCLEERASLLLSARNKMEVLFFARVALVTDARDSITSNIMKDNSSWQEQLSRNRS